MPKSRIGEYLRARRALVQPEDVAIEREPGRRVQGLRREELAKLAGISVDYYLRLERGRDVQPSEQVIRSLARALQLDDEATGHLRRLARSDSIESEVHTSRELDPSVRGLLKQWSHTPAFVIDRNQTILESNDLARALGPGYMEPGVNLVYSIFSQASRDYAADWETTARRVVAALRLHSDPNDPQLQALIGGLSVRDPDFPRLWARHDAASTTSGRSRHFIDPIGWVELPYQNLHIPGSTQILVTFWAEPGTPGTAALAYLATRVQHDGPGANNGHRPSQVELLREGVSLPNPDAVEG